MKQKIFPEIELKRPIIISGPCSAETEKQTIETAHALSKIGIKIFRAGIWKPRTRPGLFEGVGKIGLKWLKKVKEETGMRTCVEVATKLHVRQVVEYDIDAVWLGSRTTVNPFAVKEVANALAKTNLTVFVKNPINPDIDLWVGAFERLSNVGITKLCAIHRGFSVYGNSVYRNPPQWQIPIELHRRLPNLPILTDPSHICGTPNHLKEVCQKALDLNFDGLMIETHITPEHSLSDKQQQISPEELNNLLNSLIIRKSESENESQDELIGYRKQIDSIDFHIIDLLNERMKISKDIGNYKRNKNITIFQSARYNELIESRIKTAKELGLSPEFITDIFKSIHEESVSSQ
ncbi:MAG: bifunctional 3-deoxy-7-phosphoheptulonate synthase/chorismate mutase type II [Marinilabiliaceae bacterium]|nr:bifunctional 3-deoxy-7-phosphoheptulonate synthase/chorismate mutase type II [Marinilabiliaceae bacterium]